MNKEQGHSFKIITPIDPIMRLPEVMRATGLGRGSVYKALKDGTFPVPVKITKRAVGWRVSQIQAWLDSRK